MPSGLSRMVASLVGGLTWMETVACQSGAGRFGAVAASLFFAPFDAPAALGEGKHAGHLNGDGLGFGAFKGIVLAHIEVELGEGFAALVDHGVGFF